MELTIGIFNVFAIGAVIFGAAFLILGLILAIYWKRKYK